MSKDCVTCMTCHFKECQCGGDCTPKCMDKAATCEEVTEMYEDLVKPLPEFFENAEPCDIPKMSSKGFKNVFNFLANFVNVLCHVLTLLECINSRMETNKKNLQWTVSYSKALCDNINQLTNMNNNLVVATDNTVRATTEENERKLREYKEEYDRVSAENMLIDEEYQKNSLAYVQQLSLSATKTNELGYLQAPRGQYLHFQTGDSPFRVITGRFVDYNQTYPSKVATVPQTETKTITEDSAVYIAKGDTVRVEFPLENSYYGDIGLTMAVYTFKLMETDHPSNAAILQIPRGIGQAFTIRTNHEGDQKYSTEFLATLRVYNAHGEEIGFVDGTPALLNLIPAGSQNGLGSYFSEMVGAVIPINGSLLDYKDNRYTNRTYELNYVDYRGSVVFQPYGAATLRLGSYKNNNAQFIISDKVTAQGVPVYVPRKSPMPYPQEPNLTHIHENTGILSGEDCQAMEVSTYIPCATRCSKCPPLGKYSELALEKGLSYITVSTFIDRGTGKPIAPASHLEGVNCGVVPDDIWYNKKWYSIVPEAQELSPIQEGTDPLLGRGMIQQCKNYYKARKVD